MSGSGYPSEPLAAAVVSPGLCADCAHAKRIANDRGSVFWMCLRSLEDNCYRKYPRLPVTACAGHEQRPEA